MSDFEIDCFDLNPDQMRRWNDCRSTLAQRCPGYRHMWYRLLNRRGDDNYYAQMTKDQARCPVASTDGMNININVDTFFDDKFTLANRVFIMCHEIGHNFLDDVRFLRQCAMTKKVPQKKGPELPFDEPSMQRAMDYRLNAILVEGKCGTIPKGALYDPKIATALDGLLDTYAKVYKAKPPGGYNNEDLISIVLPPGSTSGTDPNTASNNRNAQQWMVETATALRLEADSRSKGILPGGLKRMFDSVLAPEIPWTDYVQTTVMACTGNGFYDWRTPDPWFIGRDIYLPAPTGKNAGWVVLYGDTSGSISVQEHNVNFALVGQVLDMLRPKRLTVLWCDTKIDYVDELTNAADLTVLKCRGVKGGGGSNVKPVFEWIKKNSMDKPEIFIGLTDGYITFPDREPDFNVLWCSTTDAKYPWGEVVKINGNQKDHF